MNACDEIRNGFYAPIILTCETDTSEVSGVKQERKKKKKRILS